MIKRFYVNNFRCLESFELPIAGLPSTLLIGKNGSGKSTIGRALQVLQSVARGTNRIGSLLGLDDFSRGHSEMPMRFELEVELDQRLFQYELALEWPEGFKELRVAEESLSQDGVTIYARDNAQVTLSKTPGYEAQFLVDWHLVALPLIQVQSQSDPIHVFKNWLSRMLILAPVPLLMSGDSEEETLFSDTSCSNFGAWFSGLLAHSPSSYTQIDQFIRQVMPDFQDIKNPPIGRDSRSLSVQFKQEKASISLAFSDLADGEKCFFVCALVLAANAAYGPIFCFWDEPDNYLSPSEVGHFVMDLRRSFEHSGGQLVATSHNTEAIPRFSAENTLLLRRRNHLEPTIVRLLSDEKIEGNLVEALIRDDI